MKNSTQVHVAGEDVCNPALKAILPLVQQWRHRDVDSDIYANPDEIPDPRLWPPEMQASVAAAQEGIENSEMGWVLGAPSEATSSSHVYTEALGRFPSTPESVRSKERAAHRAVDRDWDDPDYRSGYELMQEANCQLREHLAQAERTINRHNANHVLNQAVITQLKQHIRTQEQRKKGPVQELVGTKDQFYLNFGNMRKAIKKQNRDARKKEKAKKRRQSRRDTKKDHQKVLDALKARRAEWRKDERERRAALIEEDRETWLAKRTPAQLSCNRQAPKNPRGRRKEGTPDDLQDPPMPEEEEEEDDDNETDDSEDEDTGSESEHGDGHQEFSEQGEAM
jgi:hypothetical protein